MFKYLVFACLLTFAVARPGLIAPVVETYAAPPLAPVALHIAPPLAPAAIHHVPLAYSAIHPAPLAYAPAYNTGSVKSLAYGHYVL